MDALETCHWICTSLVNYGQGQRYTDCSWCMRIHCIAGNIKSGGVSPKFAISRILADLNLVVQYGIAIRIYMRVENFGGF